MSVTAVSAPLQEINMGDMAPDVTVRRDDGSEISLSQLWRDNPVVLVFLRHLGCIFCREHVARLRHDEARFHELGATIALITMGQPHETAEFCAARAPEEIFICLSDPEAQAYRAFGLSRGTSAEVMAPRVWGRGLQAMLHGNFPGIPRRDPMQMPGVFIVDRSGTVRYAYRSKDSADNPPNGELLNALAALSA